MEGTGSVKIMTDRVPGGSKNIRIRIHNTANAWAFLSPVALRTVPHPSFRWCRLLVIIGCLFRMGRFSYLFLVRIRIRTSLSSSKCHCQSIPCVVQHWGRSHSRQRVQADRRGRRQGTEQGRDLRLPQAAGWGDDDILVWTRIRFRCRGAMPLTNGSGSGSGSGSCYFCNYGILQEANKKQIF